MKVLLINGSPHPRGCTRTALDEVAGQLERQGIETEHFNIGSGPFYACTACRACLKTGRCIQDGDPVNRCIDLLKQSDGLVVGSPVYYAGVNGGLCAVLDRVFYASQDIHSCKPAAAVVSCRRGGASAAFDRLNKYFTISKMPVVSSQYWNAVHGNTPDEVRKDAEGMQIMRTLGTQMAWMLHSIHQARGAVSNPEYEARVRTNFIR